MPDVSVVLCVYNTRRYIAEAVNSILRQEGADFELLVVDDASTDGSRDIVADLIKNDPRARLIQLEQNLGLAGAMNVGIAEARTPWVAHMDSDDVALPQRLARQLAFLETRPGVDFLGTSIRSIDADGHLSSSGPMPMATTPDFIAWRMPFGNVLVNPTMMSRTEILRAHPYSRDATYRYCVDYELWCRLNWRYKFDNLTEPLVHYRIHSNSGSSQYRESQDKAALTCSRRCAEELLGTPIDPGLFKKLHVIGTPLSTISIQEFQQLCGILSRMLTHFMARKIRQHEKITDASSVLYDYIARLQQLAAATGRPPEEITTLLQAEQAAINASLKNLANSYSNS